MSNKLQRLISHYEAERRTLTAEMNDCVAEGDYGTARRLAKGLRQVSHKLQTLLNLQDPLHDEKESATGRIQGLETLSEGEEGRTLTYYQEWIAAEKQKLAALQAHNAERPALSPPTVLHLALTKLLDTRIASFSFVLSEPKSLQLTFLLLRKTLLITLPEVRRHRASYVLQKKQIRLLQGLGFRLYDRQDKLLLFLPFTDAADIKTAKSLLARISFECFYYKEFAGHSALKYCELPANS